LSEKKLRQLIVPIFIPNQGCPHRCVFCEQERITSTSVKSLNTRRITSILDTAIASTKFDPKLKPEVAFYGGTFTGLPPETVKRYLSAIQPYLMKGLFHSIRLSTRPDAIDMDRLQILKDHGVRTVELGAQSMDDSILALSKRGHTADDTVRAVQILKEMGFRVGIQLMPGLPGDTKESFRATIRSVIGLQPDMVRLYPVLVIRGTVLEQWYKEGRYLPLKTREAVDFCIESCINLESEGIPVIRIGLMSSPSLLEKGQILDGPWHPAFGFLVRSGVYHIKIDSDLPAPGEFTQIKIKAPKKEISLLRGYKNEGLELIEAKTKAKILRIKPDETISSGRIKVEEV